MSVRTVPAGGAAAELALSAILVTLVVGLSGYLVLGSWAAAKIGRSGKSDIENTNIGSDRLAKQPRLSE